MGTGIIKAYLGRAQEDIDKVRKGERKVGLITYVPGGSGEPDQVKFYTAEEVAMEVDASDFGFEYEGGSGASPPTAPPPARPRVVERSEEGELVIQEIIQLFRKRAGGTGRRYWVCPASYAASLADQYSIKKLPEVLSCSATEVSWLLGRYQKITASGAQGMRTTYGKSLPHLLFIEKGAQIVVGRQDIVQFLQLEHAYMEAEESSAFHRALEERRLTVDDIVHSARMPPNQHCLVDGDIEELSWEDPIVIHPNTHIPEIRAAEITGLTEELFYTDVRNDVTVMVSPSDAEKLCSLDERVILGFSFMQFMFEQEEWQRDITWEGF